MALCDAHGTSNSTGARDQQVNPPEDSVEFVAGRPRWWQWPTMLSLDAPSVAVLWQWMLASAVGVRLEGQHVFLLAAAAWMVYCADRWIEGFLLTPDQVRTQRHWFYKRWRWPSFAVWVAVALISLFTALTRLTRTELIAGSSLCPLVLTYLLSHQLAHRNHPWRAPKEICVAILFSLGSACFPLVRAPDSLPRMAVPLGLFAMLCFANCALIALWEADVDISHGQTSLVLQFPRSRGLVRALPWLIAAAAAWAAWPSSGVQRSALACAAASGSLLGLLDLAHLRCGRQLARVLADVALMSPAVPWLVGKY
jgi:hypothetical protein